MSAAAGTDCDFKTVDDRHLCVNQRDVEVPAVIDITGTRLTVTGQFPIKQSDFGMKPFSIGLGALEVVDQLQVRFKIVADRKEN